MQPLAERIRPQTLEDIVGQDHLLSDDSSFRKYLQQGKMPSLLLAGPPGTGKTTLARALADHLHANYIELSAAAAGTPQIREVVKKAQAALPEQTVLFLDEIHQFNKTQQNALLPHVENGLIKLIGATTENPQRALIRPLQSRCHIVRLKKLKETDLDLLIDRALSHEMGLPGHTITDEAKQAIVHRSAGDGRSMLAWLERAAQLGKEITLENVEAAAGEGHIRYDVGGDWQYNLISAYIKSMRAGEEKAALVYLASMMAGGEDPVYIARRLLIFAAEDVGLADPQALTLAHAAMTAAQTVGFPECAIPMSMVTIYCSRAKKDRSSYDALQKAKAWVEEHGTPNIPRNLRNQDWHP